MGTSKKLGVLVAVLMLVAVGTWRMGIWGGDEPSATSPGPGTAAVAPRAVAPLRASQAKAVATKVLEEGDPVGNVRLEGQVIDANEAPVAGALVSISSVPPRTVVSEDDGSFAFSELGPRSYALEAHKGDAYAGPLRLALRGNTEPAILRLTAGRAVTVEVRSAQDRSAVEDAIVEIRSSDAMSWESTTNSDGAAAFAGIRPGDATLHVRADGYAAVALRLTDAAPTVWLQPGVEVSGVVVDQANAAIADALVIAVPASEPFALLDRRDAVSTDSQGQFRFASLAAGNYRFTVLHQDHASVDQAPISIGGASVASVKLVVQTGASIVGTVTDSSGAAVSGVALSFVAKGSVPWRTRRRALTDADGHYRLSALSWSEGDLVAAGDTNSSETIAVDLQKGGEHEVNLQLTIAGAIRGTVVNAGGETVPEAQVYIEPVWTGAAGQRDAWAVRAAPFHVADGGGAFTISGLPKGQYQLRAAPPGGSEGAYLLHEAVTASPGEEAARLLLSDVVMAHGKVQLEGGRAPAVFTVAVDAAPPEAFSSRDGAFRLEVPEGDHVLRISGPAFVPKTVRAAVAPGAEHDLGTIAVEPGRVITGLVLDSEGALVPDCEVAAGALLTGDGSKLYIEDESLMAQSTRTDEEGRFVLGGLGPHPVTLVAGNASGRSRYQRLPASKEGAELTLVLEPTAALRGMATLDDKPVAETVIIATPLGTNASNFVVTGSDGSFAYDALPAGSYMVFPMIGGGGGKPKDMFVVMATVSEAGGSTVTIDAKSGTRSLDVAALDAEGRPMMAQVIVMQDPLELITDGRYAGDTFLDGSWLRGHTIDAPVAIYIRGAATEPAKVDALVPGRYAACIAPRVLMGPPAAMTCRTVTVSDTGERQAVEVRYAPEDGSEED